MQYLPNSDFIKTFSDIFCSNIIEIFFRYIYNIIKSKQIRHAAKSSSTNTRKGYDIMSFSEINVRDLPSPVSLINDGWGLITAGDKDGYNTMTASWGALGELWNKDAAFIFVRPQRYTREFIENSEYFSFSFFNDKYKTALRFCGANSGRDVDKSKETGLIPVFDNSTTYFEQAEFVIICKKIAFQDIDPSGFIDKSIDKNYADADYHRMYVGEIIKVLSK